MARNAMADKDTQRQIATLVAAIRPAVKTAKMGSADTLDQSVRINIVMVVRQLRSAVPVLAPLVEAGRIKIPGAHYDLASSVVELHV